MSNHQKKLGYREGGAAAKYMKGVNFCFLFEEKARGVYIKNRE